jgi:UDP-N-acetyl-D-glucosamine dehydrogenase
MEIANKAKVADACGAPAAEIMELLAELGAMVNYSDPNIPSCPSMPRHGLESVSFDLSSCTITSHDCLDMTLDQDALDYEQIKEFSQLI